jgi:hypothetical protein
LRQQFSIGAVRSSGAEILDVHVGLQHQHDSFQFLCPRPREGRSDQAFSAALR